LKTELTQIPGIGKAISDKLLKHFGSVEAIKTAQHDDIAKVVGKSKAEVIFKWIKNGL